MHELALTQGIIDIVCSEQKKQGFNDVREIRLKVGEYSGIVPDYIKDFFPTVSKGTCAERASLVISFIPAEIRCLDCGFEGKPGNRKAFCPQCGGTAFTMIKGREFYVENILVE